MTGYVYAISHGDLVKIGFSHNPDSRFRSLQTGQPERYSLIGSVPATKEQERDLHGLLSKARVRAEWFRRSKAVEAFLGFLQPAAPPVNSVILSEIDAFLFESGMSASGFGRAVVNDPHLVRRMRLGRRVLPDTAQRVRQFIAARRAKDKDEAAA